MQTEHTRTQKHGLISDLTGFIETYIFMPSDEAALIASLFVMHTWAFEAARATPYIYVHSPEKQSGKTKLIDVLSLLVRNPLMGTSMTGPVLFRAIQAFNRPTLLLDEVDGIFHGSKNEEFRLTLNSGYRAGGHVWRVVKGEPQRFVTYCPKLLAGINNGKLPDTVADRAIPIRMRRKPKNVVRKPFYIGDVQGSPEIERLLSRIERWCDVHMDALSVIRPEPIKEISDRKWEIAEPLVAIAQKMGIEDDARNAITKILEDSDESEGLSDTQELLLNIREAFGERQRIFTQELVEHLGEPWTGKLLGNALKPYGVAPKLIRIGNSTQRGYNRSQFEGVWESYL